MQAMRKGDDAMTDVSTTLLCVICSTVDKPRRATPGYRTCNRCVDHLREALVEIPERYATIGSGESLLPVIAPGGRRGPGFGSRSPARDSVIALTDHRSNGAYGGVHSPLAVLESWARAVREDTGQAQPKSRATVFGEARFLVKWLDWITRQYWVDDLWTEVKEVRDQLRATTDYQKSVPVGRCTNLLDTGDCGTPLYAPLHGDTIRCRSCHREWSRREWLHLGQTMGVVS